MTGLQLTLDAYLAEGVADAKAEGLDASEATASAWAERIVYEAIVAIAPGQPLSMNDLREKLDDADVPAKPRPGLMRAACRDGLLVPYMIDVAGQTVQASIPSTGASASGAYVKVYRRTSATWSVPVPQAVA